MNMTIVHKHFEMGVAPYRFRGFWAAPSKGLQEHNPAAYNNAMSTKPECCHFSCDHCGTGITNHCIIKDSTGKLFVVGSTCLEKLHDVENLDDAKIAKRRHDKKMRQLRDAAKRQQQREQREADLVRQRAVNGGLTDYEVERKREMDAEQQRRDANMVDAKYFIDGLRSTNTGFASDVAGQLIRNRSFPYGRGESIMLDIVTKYHSGSSRTGTKAFDAEYDTAVEKLDQLKSLWGDKI